MKALSAIAVFVAFVFVGLYLRQPWMIYTGSGLTFVVGLAWHPEAEPNKPKPRRSVALTKPKGIVP